MSNFPLTDVGIMAKIKHIYIYETNIVSVDFSGDTRWQNILHCKKKNVTH